MASPRTEGVGPGPAESPGELGDFTTTPHVIPISLLAIGIGALSAFVALGLLRLIGLFTNLFFYQRWSSAFSSPTGHHLGPFVVVVPVIGALIIGFMARYGSERIRGHGIPEAIEAILMGGSRVEPRVAVLKPLSAAISIGSGGPFGAEGYQLPQFATIIRPAGGLAQTFSGLPTLISALLSGEARLACHARRVIMIPASHNLTIRREARTYFVPCCNRRPGRSAPADEFASPPSAPTEWLNLTSLTCCPSC